MNKTVVVYQSTYGTTRLYAEQIAQKLCADLVECKKAKISALIQYDTIILGGGIYAGRIAGSNLLGKNYEKLSGKLLVVFSVGFTPQSRTDILEKVRNNSFEDIPSKNIEFFHFRGGFDYKKLNLFHRILLAAKRFAISIQPKNKLTADNKRFLNLYGKSTKVILDSTQPLIEFLKA